jgi:multidrug resistance efflux pump
VEKKANNSHMFRRSCLRHAVPVTVWLIGVGAVAWLLYQRAERFETVGIARGQVLHVAASSTGRIRDIAVDLFKPVKAGQTLAVVDAVGDNEQLDEAKLKAQLAAAAAEAERFLAQLIPTQEKLRAETANLQSNREDNWRRFEVDVDSARLRILDLQAIIASEQVTLDDLAMQVKINQKLLEEDAIVPYELEKVKVHYESTAKRVQENGRLLEQARAVLRETEQRRDEFATHEMPTQSEDAALEVIRKQIEVQDEVMKGLLEQLAVLKSHYAVELKSPIDGVVVPIHVQETEARQQRPGEPVVRRAGEVVKAGDPILAVAQTEPTEIVAYVSEQQLGSLREQMPVELVKTRTPAQIARSEVLCIGPAIELMPQRLWRSPNIPQWGRPVLIRIPPGLALVPGEIVGVRGL